MIGDGCFIDSNVRIHDNVTLGTDCVKSGAVLGGEALDSKRMNMVIGFVSQIGGLIIGNNVE